MHGTQKELKPARSEPITQEFLTAIWRAIAKVDGRQRQELERETDDVDAVLAEQAAELESPERATAPRVEVVHLILDRLMNELREERSAIEAADYALAREHEFMSQTLARPGSSRHSAGRDQAVEAELARQIARLEHEVRNTEF